MNYVDSFNNLYDSIKEKAFDHNKSLIPINYEGIIIDGSHRTSIGILLGLELPVCSPVKSVPTIPLTELRNRFAQRRENLLALRTYLWYQKMLGYWSYFLVEINPKTVTSKNFLASMSVST